ncbi:MAG TPA: hypothetical protein DD733_02790 [Clostridiales bacterium]|nr:dockerin type I domain-containing protein [Eubacteriales bacterium]HBR30990.1 hypothetical protein [Clostridiales bacterium]
MKKIISVIITLLLVIPVSIFYSSAQETNIALGKSYSYTGTYVDEGVIMYPDTDRKELTDGIKGDGDDIGFVSPIWVGMNINGVNSQYNSNEITVDLGSIQNKLIRFTLTAESCDGGISTPNSVEVMVSDDNKDFTSAGVAYSATRYKSKDMSYSVSESSITSSIFSDYSDVSEYYEPSNYGIYTYSVVLDGAISARYIKYVIHHGASWAFVSEVEVYRNPDAKDAPPNTVFVTTINESVTAGAGAIFTNDFEYSVDGDISSSDANLAWAAYLIAKPTDTEGQYIVTSVNQNLRDGYVFIPHGGFMLAAHFDDREYGSDNYYRTLKNLQLLMKFKPGNIVTLTGIDITDGTISDDAAVILYDKGNTQDPVYDTGFAIDLFSTYSYRPGDTIQAYITIKNIEPEDGIRSLRFVMYYDESNLTPKIAKDDINDVDYESFIIDAPDETWGIQAFHDSDFAFYDITVSTENDDALAKDNGSLLIMIPFTVKDDASGNIVFRSPSNTVSALDVENNEVDGKAGICTTYEDDLIVSNPTENAEITINQTETEPQLDGIVNDSEYGQKIHTTYSNDQFVSDYDTDLDIDADFYMTWNSDNLYLSWVVRTENHYPVSKTRDYNNDGKAGTDADLCFMWMFSCVQFMLCTGAPKIDDTNYQTTDWSGNYLEAGLSIMEDDSSYIAIWSRPVGAEDLSVTDLEFAGNRNEAASTTTYEVKIPWDAIGMTNVDEGTELGLTYSIGDQEDFDVSPNMCEWQNAILGRKNMDAGAVITLSGENAIGSAIISGTCKVGEILSAGTVGIVTTGKILKYQWYRNGIAIPDATNRTYLLVEADIAKEIMVIITVKSETEVDYESDSVIPIGKSEGNDYSVTLKNGYANGIINEQRKSDLILRITGAFTILDSKNNQLAENSFIGTGCVIRQGNNSFTVIIKGDINGDGIVNAKDYLLVKRAYLDTLTLTETQRKAACLEDTTEPTSKDYLKIKRHFLGTFNIYE